MTTKKKTPSDTHPDVKTWRLNPDQMQMPARMATLQFNLDTPEGTDALKDALSGFDSRMALYDLAQELRKKLKYETISEEAYAALEQFRKFFYETLNYHNVKIED